MITLMQSGMGQKTQDNPPAPPTILYGPTVYFFLFPKIKKTLKEHHFQTVDKTEGNTIQQLNVIHKNAF